jgi:hypothetical protein
MSKRGISEQVKTTGQDVRQSEDAVVETTASKKEAPPHAETKENVIEEANVEEAK